MNTRLGFALALLTAGCIEEASTRTNEQRVSYRDDVQPIWDRWCTRCHNFHTPHLTAAESAEDLQELSWAKCDGGTEKARFIVPGDPEKSFLLFKLTAVNTNNYLDGCGRPMPADQAGRSIPLIELDPDAVATIRTWIEAGADFD